MSAFVCSFVPVSLCILYCLYWDFAFLIIVLRVLFFCWFFCNIASGVYEDWSPVWYPGLWDKWGATKKKLFTKGELYNFRWIFVLILINYIKWYIYIYIRVKKKKRRKKWEWAQRLPFSKWLTMEGVSKRCGSIGNCQALMGLYWGF